jgi:integrase
LTLLAESGIRVGEALGLAWPCVDLEAETIAIIGQLGPDGEVRETTTMRRRVIPISVPGGVGASRAPDADARAGPGRDDRARVRDLERQAAVEAECTSRVERGARQDRRRRKPARLRHSFISAHAERDTPVVLVSDLVGHSRVTTTQTHYTRVRGGERQRIESLRSAL